MKRHRIGIACFASAWLFLLAARATAGEPFFFIQLTDPQFGMFTTNRDFAQETANLQFAVAAVNRLRPAFVVVTGDLVNEPGDPAQMAEYQRLIGLISPAIPVYSVAGNHDLGNVPTPASVAGFTNRFGPDHYAFRYQDFVGLVLNSILIHSPQQTTNQLAEQDRWLRTELDRARRDRAKHVVVFAHHPWFLRSADEPDEYFNLPRDRRAPHLALFREFGVKYLFSGHYHRNAVARDGGLEAVTTGPVGKPLGEGKSGLRVVIVRDDRLEHRFYDFGDLPDHIDLPALEKSRVPSASAQ